MGLGSTGQRAAACLAAAMGLQLPCNNQLAGRPPISLLQGCPLARLHGPCCLHQDCLPARLQPVESGRSALYPPRLPRQVAQLVVRGLPYKYG